jgi:hypothetical protein
MRNAQWRSFLRDASRTPQAEAPSLFNLPGVVIDAFVCGTAVSFGFREPRCPLRLPERPREPRPPTQNCWVRLVMQSPAVKWKLNRGSSLMTG